MADGSGGGGDGMPLMSTFVEIGGDSRGLDGELDKLPAKVARRLQQTEQSIRAQMARNSLAMKGLGDGGGYRMADDQAKYDALSSANAQLAARFDQVAASARRKEAALKAMNDRLAAARYLDASAAASSATMGRAASLAAGGNQKLASSSVYAGQAIGKAGGAARSNAMGFLLLSQAVEDAQYGFGAVVNNIPGIVMAMGGSAGLAGAVSMVAVGLNVATTHLGLFDSALKPIAGSAADVADGIKKINKEIETLESTKPTEPSTWFGRRWQGVKDYWTGAKDQGPDYRNPDTLRGEAARLEERESNRKSLIAAKSQDQKDIAASVEKAVGEGGGLPEVARKLAMSQAAELAARTGSREGYHSQNIRAAEENHTRDILDAAAGDKAARDRLKFAAGQDKTGALAGFAKTLDKESPEAKKAKEAETARAKARDDVDEEIEANDALNLGRWKEAQARRKKRAKEVADEAGKSLELDLLRRNAMTSDFGKQASTVALSGRLEGAGVDKDAAERLAKDAVDLALKEVTKQVNSRVLNGQAADPARARAGLRRQLEVEVADEKKASLRKQLGEMPQILGIDEYLSRLQTEGTRPGGIADLAKKQDEGNKTLVEIAQNTRGLNKLRKARFN